VANHLLWGGPSLEAEPILGRPALAELEILRFWQHHRPSLSLSVRNVPFCRLQFTLPAR